MATIARTARQRKAQARRPKQTQRRRRRQAKRLRPRRPLPRGVLRVAGDLVKVLAAAFTRPTAERFVVLLFAAILTTGCRTILNMLRTVNQLAPGHPSSYHRVFSKRRWSLWRLGRALAGYILTRWVPTGTVALAGDDILWRKGLAQP